MFGMKINMMIANTLCEKIMLSCSSSQARIETVFNKTSFLPSECDLTVPKCTVCRRHRGHT